MDKRKVNNKWWNGEDSAFLRCVDSRSGYFYDVPILGGTDVSMYKKMCKAASLFVNNIVSEEYHEFDYWIRFNVSDGEIVGSDKDIFFGGINSIDGIYFKFDIDTLLAIGVFVINTHQFRNKITSAINGNLISDKESVMSDYNSIIKKQSEYMIVTEDSLKSLEYHG